jgi:hypothetical protein
MRSLMSYVARILGISFACGSALLPHAFGSDRLSANLLRSVLRIETAPDAAGNFEIGSGFLVSTTENEAGRVLLITNKHMVGDWNPVDRDIKTFHPWVNVFFYRNGDPSYRPTKVNILAPTGLLDSKVHLYPSPEIDLVAIDVSNVTNDKSEGIASVSYARSFFLRFDRVRDFETDIGDQVFALGYPLGIRSLQNDYPLAKTGYLSSLPGEEVNIPFPGVNRQGVRSTATFKGKFLIVDGLIVPGNSGGPVIIVGGIRSRRNPSTNQLEFTDKPIQNLVVGVVSCGLGASGLTVVISADYVLDWIASSEFK